MGATVFISYATKDSNKFHIATIAERLTKYPEIDKALYWEEDMLDDIYKYMNENVGKCDVFLLFCSQNALNSEPIEMEWMAALKKKKKIIPIFIDEDDIPTLLSTRLGVQFKENDLKGTIKSVYHLILKKLYVSPKGAEESIEKAGIVDFKGAPIPQFEAEVLQELENQIGKQFKLVNGLNMRTQMGFTVENQRINGIGLYDCGVSTLPESISKLTSLKILWIYQNQLATFPESIGKLISLEELCLGYNKLTILSESIGDLKLLQILDLGVNKLTSLPESIGNLNLLQLLSLDKNQLITLPESISNLKSLQTLGLGWNQLSTFPESIGNLQSLKELHLAYNKLTSLPESIGNLTSLQTLSFNDNKITALPESIKILEQRGVRIYK